MAEGSGVIRAESVRSLFFRVPLASLLPDDFGACEPVVQELALAVDQAPRITHGTEAEPREREYEAKDSMAR